MILEGPQQYRLTYTLEGFQVRCPEGRPHFSGIASSKMPKLYVVSIDGHPVYVGITKQPIRNRLRLGWQAAGQTGYHGYAWRRVGTNAAIDIWAQTNASERSDRDIKTVEAEVVYLLRKTTEQWPKYQTEIHFFPSTEIHRAHAEEIVQFYGLAGK